LRLSQMEDAVRHTSLSTRQDTVPLLGAFGRSSCSLDWTQYGWPKSRNPTWLTRARWGIGGKLPAMPSCCTDATMTSCSVGAHAGVATAAFVPGTGRTPYFRNVVWRNTCTSNINLCPGLPEGPEETLGCARLCYQYTRSCLTRLFLLGDPRISAGLWLWLLAGSAQCSSSCPRYLA
jgi:hypothetical protein